MFDSALSVIDSPSSTHLIVHSISKFHPPSLEMQLLASDFKLLLQKFVYICFLLFAFLYHVDDGAPAPQPPTFQEHAQLKRIYAGGEGLGICGNAQRISSTDPLF